MAFDYGTLRLIWWALLGVLLMGFAAMDGFDLGVAAQLGFVARSDIERRVATRSGSFSAAARSLPPGRRFMR